MRVIVNCAGGSHSMMLQHHTTVLDIKQHIAKKSGVPPGLQLLLFAGHVLGPDSALALEELALDTYSLAQEVVVYMQRQLADPVQVILCQPALTPFKAHAELVESSSPLTNIMSLLTQCQLTCRPFPAPVTSAPVASTAAAAHVAPVPGAAAGEQGSTSGTRAAGDGTPQCSVATAGILPSCVVVKRQDGSCCSRVKVTENQSIAQLKTAIEQAEGTPALQLTFYQAPDGCLHAVYSPSQDVTPATHAVCCENAMPVLHSNSGSSVSHRSLLEQLATVQ